MKKNLIIFIFLFFLCIISFFNLWLTFFQQDEWYWFGKIIYASNSGFWNLFRVTGFHFFPFSTLTIAALYKIFNLQFSSYVFCSLFLHTLNAFLVFFIGRKITNNSKIGMLASMFFLVANTSQQAVTWIGAAFSVLPAAFFGLMSFLFFLKYIHEKSKNRYLALSAISLFCGLLFKEDIVFLFAFYPLHAYLFQKKYFSKFLIINGMFGVLYIGSRIVIQVVSPQAMAVGQGFSLPGILSVFFTILLLPLQSFSKLYISPDVILSIAHRILDRFRTPIESSINIHAFGNFDLFVEKIGVAVVSTMLTAMMLIGGYFLQMMRSNGRQPRDKLGKTIFFFTILSILPFGLLPKQLGMESRHFYFPMVGASLLFSIVIFHCMNKLNRPRLAAGILLLIGLFIIFNINLNRQFINRLIETSQSRADFVSQVESLYKNLPKKTIVLATGDSFNFQSGVGEMLLVILHDRQPYYKFLDGYFLWDMGSQGYKQIEDEAFGYFTDYTEMKKSYNEFNLKPENVFSFYWNSKSRKLTNNTNTTRTMLKEN